MYICLTILSGGLPDSQVCHWLMHIWPCKSAFGRGEGKMKECSSFPLFGCRREKKIDEVG